MTEDERLLKRCKDKCMTGEALSESESRWLVGQVLELQQELKEVDFQRGVEQAIAGEMRDVIMEAGREQEKLQQERDEARAALGRAVVNLRQLYERRHFDGAVAQAVTAILTDPQGQAAAERMRRLEAVAVKGQAALEVTAYTLVPRPEWDAFIAAVGDLAELDKAGKEQGE